MQIKFLKTSTALACLAGVAMVCAWAGGGSVCYGMDDWDVEEAVRRGVEQAMLDKERRRDARQSEEKEKRRAHAFKTARFTDDSEGEEFRREYNEKQRRAEKNKSELKKLEKKQEEGPRLMKEYYRIVGSLENNNRQLWEEWDKERNWRAYYDVLKRPGMYVNAMQGAYTNNAYYTSSSSTQMFGARGGTEEAIVRAGLAGERLSDINYFMEHMTDMPEQIRELRAFRAEQDEKYKKSKSESRKNQHRALFPRKNERCNIS